MEDQFLNRSKLKVSKIEKISFKAVYLKSFKNVKKGLIFEK